jgi:hypothetical protein
MANLLNSYIIMYAIASPLLGKYIDSVYNRSGGANGGDIHPAIRNVAGVHFTVICILVFVSTFVPKGSLSLNPALLNDEDLAKDIDDESVPSDGEVAKEAPYDDMVKAN